MPRASRASTTYQLTFQWTNSIATTHVDAITLSVTDSNSHIETYTYDFQLLRGGAGTSGNATWPQSLAPNTVSAGRPGMVSDYVSVDSNSGALDTSIPLPSYNPNVRSQRPDLRFVDSESAADHHR